MFGINIIKIAKQELMKVDERGAKGVPDALEALDIAEDALKTLASFTEQFDRDDAVSVLSFFNSLLQHRFTDAEIMSAANALEVLPEAMREVSRALDSIEADLIDDD
jgi:hypothetical protein